MFSLSFAPGSGSAVAALLGPFLGPLLGLVCVSTAAGTAAAAPLQVRDNGIPDVLPGATAGDPARGRAIVANRQVGLCLLCHTGPIPEERFQGNLAPDLAGAGDRSTPAQLRLRIADASRLDPDTIMPSYFKAEGLSRVADAYQGKPILTAQQVEDVVAYLQTLKAPPSREGRQ